MLSRNVHVRFPNVCRLGPGTTPSALVRPTSLTPSLPPPPFRHGRAAAAATAGLKTSSHQHQHQQQRSAAHDSLTSFLRHAARTSLARDSTVYAGTLYEYQCQTLLRNFGFALSRTGGAGDAGIDLAGTWSLPPTTDYPSSGFSLPAVVQCKALNRKTGPAQVRELEGTLAARPPGTVGLLCSTKPATKAVGDAMRVSKRPLVWMQIEQVASAHGTAVDELRPRSNSDDDADAGAGLESEEEVIADGAEEETQRIGHQSPPLPTVRARQMLWNEAVEAAGTRGISLALFRTASAPPEDGPDVVLLWNGEIWQPPEVEEKK